MLESFSPDLSNLSIYTILFLSMLSNGIINFPSSQFVYLTFGYILNVKEVSAVLGILLGTVANTISNYILFLICLKGSSKINKRVSDFMNLNQEKIDTYTEMVQKRGSVWMVLGKITPSVKVFIPIVAGLAKVSKIKALAIFFFGSLIWACGVTYLGYYFGQRLDLAQFYGFYFLFVLVIGVFISLLYNLKRSNK